MCWNETVSIITFIIGTLLCIIGFYRSNTLLSKWVYIFFECVLLVQLGEAFVWKDPDCGTYGKIGTFIAFFGVWLQPIIGLYILSLLSVKNWIYIVYTVFIFIYIISSLSYIKHITSSCYVPLCTDTCNNPHISFTTWQQFSLMGIMYMICIIVLLIAMYPTFPSISIYVFIAMILSILFYKNTFGSMWCWFSAFTPFIALVTNV